VSGRRSASPPGHPRHSGPVGTGFQRSIDVFTAALVEQLSDAGQGALVDLLAVSGSGEYSATRAAVIRVLAARGPLDDAVITTALHGDGIGTVPPGRWRPHIAVLSALLSDPLLDRRYVEDIGGFSPAMEDANFEDLNALSMLAASHPRCPRYVVDSVIRVLRSVLADAPIAGRDDRKLTALPWAIAVTLTSPHVADSDAGAVLGAFENCPTEWLHRAWEPEPHAALRARRLSCGPRVTEWLARATIRDRDATAAWIRYAAGDAQRYRRTLMMIALSSPSSVDRARAWALAAPHLSSLCGPAAVGGTDDWYIAAAELVAVLRDPAELTRLASLCAIGDDDEGRTCLAEALAVNPHTPDTVLSRQWVADLLGQDVCVLVARRTTSTEVIRALVRSRPDLAGTFVSLDRGWAHVVREVHIDAADAGDALAARALLNAGVAELRHAGCVPASSLLHGSILPGVLDTPAAADMAAYVAGRLGDDPRAIERFVSLVDGFHGSLKELCDVALAVR
jgi:hypothetical protein